MKEGERERPKISNLWEMGKMKLKLKKKFQKNSEGQVMESSHQEVQK